MNIEPFNPLPDIKQQFVQQYYEPVERTLPANMRTRFEVAKERYEAEHKHQFPYGYDAFCKMYYGR